MRSLRARLLVGVIGGMALQLTLFSLLIYGVIHGALVEQFDTSLESVAQVLAASVERHTDRIDLELNEQEMPEFRNARHPTHYEFWQADGTVAAKSPLLGAQNLPRLDGALDSPVFGTSHDRAGKPQRVVGLTFVPRVTDRDEKERAEPEDAQTLTLTVARDADELYEELGFLRWLLLIASAAVITLSFLIAAVIVKNGLHPLNSIAGEIATIKEDSLTMRVTTEPVPTEVIPIKNRLNELMSRLEASFNRERQFNADVAHELRTPLAGIRSTIEVTLARSRDAAEYREALCSCLEISKNMQSMVGNLLALAKLDAGQTGFRVAPVKIAELVDACWNSCSDKALHRDITFDNRIDPETTLETDRQSLSIILSNVLDNAAEYTERGGRIGAAACSKDDAVEISIFNTGCRLTSNQISRVFDVFWRSDSSRTAAGIHCGLGLALVQRLARVLGGRAVAKLEPAGVFTIQVTLPLTP
jgi:two-component system, OmpR family, heavy metal sensor histidine kinase CusS